MMTDWYQKSINALTLNGKAERSQEAYTRAVRMLSQFYGKSPGEVTEKEVEDYFLQRRNVDHWSPNTMRICDSRHSLLLRAGAAAQLAPLRHPARQERGAPARHFELRGSAGDPAVRADAPVTTPS